MTPKSASAWHMKPWMLIVSASLTVQAVRFCISHWPAGWVRFSDRVIDAHLLQGVDTSLRSVMYGTALLLAVAVFFLALACFLALRRFWGRGGAVVHTKVETRVVSTLSAVTIALACFTGIFGPRADLDSFSLLLFAAVAAILLLTSVKAAMARAGEGRYRMPGYSALTAIVLTSAGLSFCSSACWGNSFRLGWEDLVIVPLLAFVLSTLYGRMTPAWSGYLGISRVALDRLLTLGLAPLMTLPLLLPVSNEIQFSFSRIFPVSPLRMWVMLAFAASCLSVLIFVRSLKHGVRRRATTVINYYYFPLVVLTLSTFVNYTHYFMVGYPIDLFHWGEIAVPTQQMFQFGSVPFLDFLPTHGARDMLFQALYSLMNGYRGAEMFMWSYAVSVGAAVLIYFLLARVTSPLFSLVFTLGVPWVTLFSLHAADYFFLIIPALALCRAIERPDFTRMAMLWCSIYAAAVWRYDIGLFSAAAAGALWLGFLIGRQRGLWKATLVSWAWVTLPLLALSWLIATMKGYSLLDVADHLIAELKVLGSGQSLIRDMFPPWTSVAFLMYVVLPGVCMAYVLYFLLRKYGAKRDLSPIVYMLVFLAIASLLLSVRNLQRHGLMEGYKALFVMFLVASVPVLAGLSRMVTEAGFLMLVVVHTMMLGTYSWLSPPMANNLSSRQRRVLAIQRWTDVNFKSEELFRFVQWHDKESRLKRVIDVQYRGLRQFLDETIDGTKTFYDFCNATMLYMLTDRKVPRYFLQGQLLTGDPIQTEELLRFNAYHSAGRVPFVVFKQGNDWDLVDQVPNELRSYRLAEYIYKKYHPLGLIGPYQIWQANDADLKLKPNEIKEKIALRLDPSYALKDGEKREPDAEGILFKSLGAHTEVSGFAETANLRPLDTGGYWFLKLQCRTSEPGLLKAYCMIQDMPLVKELSPSIFIADSQVNEWHEVFLPIPLSGGAKSRKLLELRLVPPPGSVFGIRQAELVAMSGPLWPRIETIDQRFDFKRLPYVWARFDTNLAWKQTTVLGRSTLATVCKPGKEVALDFGPHVDKTDGNYVQLTIQSDEPGRARIRVPGKADGWIDFDVLGDPEPVDYVIRVSCLWSWMKDGKGSLIVSSPQPIWISEAVLRKGD